MVISKYFIQLSFESISNLSSFHNIDSSWTSDSIGQIHSNLLSIDYDDCDSSNGVESDLTTNENASKQTTTSKLARRRGSNMNPSKEYKLKGKLNVSTLFELESRNLTVWVHYATGLIGERKEHCDICSYIRLYLVYDKEQRQKTTVAIVETDPIFEEEFVFDQLDKEELEKYKLTFKIYNSIFSQKDELLGDANIFLSSLKKDVKETFTLDILKKKSKVRCCNTDFFLILHY